MTCAHSGKVRISRYFDVRSKTRIVIQSKLAVLYDLLFKSLQIEPHREKTGFLPMRKQRRRSASR